MPHNMTARSVNRKHQKTAEKAPIFSLGRHLVAALLAGLMAAAAGQAALAQGDRNPGRSAPSAADHSSDGSQAETEPQDAPETEEISTLRKALYKAVRRARSGSGARKVEQDEGFETIARRHARDMVERGYMAHRSPEGDGPRERVYAVFPDFVGIAGENIAMRSIRPDEDADDTALAAVEAWIDSPPHRKNLLDQRHGYVGIGVADNGKATYIVMLLASEPSYRPPPPPEPRPDIESTPGADDTSGDSKSAENSAETAPGS